MDLMTVSMSEGGQRSSGGVEGQFTLCAELGYMHVCVVFFIDTL